MKLKNHIGRTFGAVAVVGGTAAVLFTGSPAHTQFSASSTQVATINGGTVAETVTNGGFTCSGLIPPNNGPEVGSTSTYEGNSCLETLSLKNTGSVKESFDLTINSITGPASTPAALAQLQITYPNPTTSDPSATTTILGNAIPENPIHLLSLDSSSSQTFPITLSLAAESTDLTAVQNAWNGGFVNINYTITATPSAS